MNMRNRKQTAAAQNNQRNGRKKAPSRAMALTAREPKKSQAAESVVKKPAKTTLSPKEAAMPAKTDARSTNPSSTNRSERTHGAQGAQSIFAGQMQLLELLIKWSPLSIFLRMANARA